MSKTSKKHKYFGLILLFLFVSIISINLFVAASSNSEVETMDDDYELGFEEDDEFVWELTEYDKGGLKDIFGDNYKDQILTDGDYDEEGARTKYKVKDIDDDGSLWGFDCWEIEMEWWEFTTDEEFDDKEDDDGDMYVFQDPEEAAVIQLFIAVDVDDYLSDIDAPTNWDVSDNEVEIERTYLDTGEDYEIEYKYSASYGVARSYAIKDDDGETVYKWELVDEDFEGFTELQLAFQVTVGVVISICLVSIAGAAGLSYIHKKR